MASGKVKVGLLYKFERCYKLHCSRIMDQVICYESSLAHRPTNWYSVNKQCPISNDASEGMNNDSVNLMTPKVELLIIKNK